MQPHFIRLTQASGYLDMDKNRFNVDVRLYLTEIPIGVQGIAFDRLRRGLAELRVDDGA